MQTPTHSKMVGTDIHLENINHKHKHTGMSVRMWRKCKVLLLLLKVDTLVMDLKSLGSSVKDTLLEEYASKAKE